MNVLDAIRTSYLANGLSESQLQKLAEIAITRVFPNGEEFVTQDDVSRDLYIIASGTAEIIGVTGEVMGRVRAGMPIGEVSFIDARPRSVTVRSCGICEVVILPAEGLWDVLQTDCALALTALMNLSRVLCARLRATNKDLAALMAIEESEPIRARR